MPRLILLLAAVVCTLGVAITSAPARADGVYATGVEWKASTENEKLAYVLGISNLMSADFVLQQKGGRAGGSAITEMFTATSDVSVEQAVAAIDAWYAENPDETDDTVLDVIWMTLVER